MSRIAAAVFADQSSAEQAINALSGLGVESRDVETSLPDNSRAYCQLHRGPL